MTQIVIIVHLVDSIFLDMVLTALTLLLAHGAHCSRHRGSLWTVGPLLLERQVRTFAYSFCLTKSQHSIIVSQVHNILTCRLQNVHIPHFI